MERRMDEEKRGFRIEYVLMLIVTFFWAVGHPVGRIIVQRVHPFQLGAVTLSTGCIGLALFMLFSGRLKRHGGLRTLDTLVSLALGVFGFFFYQILTFSALARIPASMNAVLVSTNVIFIALLARFVLKERIAPIRAAGIALALAGAVFVTFNRGFTLETGGRSFSILGCGFSLMAAASFALYSVIGKRILSRNDPLIVAFLALLSGSVLLVSLTALTTGFEEVRSAGWAVFFLMVALGLTMIGIAYPLWFTCLKRLPASHASVYIYLTPVFAVILSLIILQERFSWLFWTGGAFILGGIIITNRFGGEKPRPSPK
jgi:drug/metabolite transporter (DMT)-like permease